MDNTNAKPRRRPIFAIIATVCASIAILLIIFGLICMVGLSQIDNNWGMIIIGLILLIIPGFIVGGIATVLSIISFIRKERLALSIVSVCLSAPIFIFLITSIISGL